MKPGDVMMSDYRDTGSSQREDQGGVMRLMQWNIERGYELAKVIEDLRACQADVIALQEIDIGCKRSQERDTGKEIAEALKMHYAFVCEFEELESPIRNNRSQGGGFHGNAILSRWDITEAHAIEHRCDSLFKEMYQPHLMQNLLFETTVSSRTDTH